MDARIWRTALPILAAGAAVRVYNLDAGLPHMLHVDGLKFVSEAARMAATGDWQPQLFQYPGLLTNLLALLYRVLGVERLASQFLTAHVIAALGGIGTMLGTWALARRVCAAGGQLLALALSGVCVVAVTYSRLPAPDILVAACTTTALAMAIADRARTPAFVLAGLLVGLAAGAKFTGVFVLPLVWLAALLFGAPARARWERVRRAAAATVAGIVAFVLTTPFVVTSAPAYAERLLREAQIQRAGQIGRVVGGSLDYVVSATLTWEQPWLSTSLLGNLGAPAVAVGLVAVGAALLGHGGRKLAFLAAVVVIFTAAFSVPGRVKAVRFLLPVLPLFYVVLAWGVAAAIARIGAGYPARIRRLTWGVAAGVVLAIPVVKTVRFVEMTRRPPTNLLAYEWGRAHLAPGAATLLSPFFVDNLRRLPLRAGTIQDAGVRQYGFPEGVGPSPERDPIYSPALLDDLRAAGVRYVILNSYFDGAFSPVPENLRFFPRSVDAYRAFRDRLGREARAVYAVGGIADGRLGPDITVYELDTVLPDAVVDRDGGA